MFSYLLLKMFIPTLAELAAIVYHPDPVPDHWVDSHHGLLEVCRLSNCSMILERRLTPEEDLFLWSPPRYNPWQWRIVMYRPMPYARSMTIGLAMESGRIARAWVSRDEILSIRICIDRLDHQIPVESNWFNTTDLVFTVLFPRLWYEAPRPDMEAQEVEEVLDEMKRVEKQWREQDAES